MVRLRRASMGSGNQVAARTVVRRISVREDSFQGALDAIEECYSLGWTDGIPVVPPTGEAVQAMLRAVDRGPQEVLGIIPPRMGIATVEVVAANAVMAGCLPEFFPVVIAAVAAMLEPAFNLNGVIGTTHSATPLAIVSGPIVKELGINAAHNVFGGGFRANATIGRAIRLVTWNIGGGKPDEGDQAVFGHPGKYSYCIAENGEDSPWPPLHTDFGLDAKDSAVTMFPCEAPHHIGGGLPAIAAHITAPGSNNIPGSNGQVMAVISPLVGQQLAQAGWAKDDVKRYLYEKARAPAMRAIRRSENIKPELRVTGSVEGPEETQPRWLDLDDSSFLAPVVREWRDIHVIVAGSKSWRWCCVLHGWGRGKIATCRKINVKGT